MSINLYDSAFLNKIKSWVRDEKMTVIGPDETRRLFQVVADQTNDKPIQLPLISLQRLREIEIRNVNKSPLTRDGMTIEAKLTTQDQNAVAKIISLTAIPISISYQLDIYCRYAEEANEYVRNFVFNLINYPKLTITIPYNDINYNHNAGIILQSSITDNSDIPERMIPGQFTRMTLQCILNDAYLFSAPIRNQAIISGVEITTE